MILPRYQISKEYENLVDEDGRTCDIIHFPDIKRIVIFNGYYVVVYSVDICSNLKKKKAFGKKSENNISMCKWNERYLLINIDEKIILLNVKTLKRKVLEVGNPCLCGVVMMKLNDEEFIAFYRFSTYKIFRLLIKRKRIKCQVVEECDLTGSAGKVDMSIKPKLSEKHDNCFYLVRMSRENRRNRLIRTLHFIDLPNDTSKKSDLPTRGLHLSDMIIHYDSERNKEYILLLCPFTRFAKSLRVFDSDEFGQEKGGMEFTIPTVTSFFNIDRIIPIQDNYFVFGGTIFGKDRYLPGSRGFANVDDLTAFPGYHLTPPGYPRNPKTAIHLVSLDFEKKVGECVEGEIVVTSSGGSKSWMKNSGVKCMCLLSICKNHVNVLVSPHGSKKAKLVRIYSKNMKFEGQFSDAEIAESDSRERSEFFLEGEYLECVRLVVCEGMEHISVPKFLFLL